MKLFLPTGTFIIWLAASSLRAQDAPLPQPSKSGDAPAETPVPALPPGELVPQDFLPAPKNNEPSPSLQDIPQLDEGFKASPLSPAADTQRNHLEWRRLMNEVQNSPSLKVARNEAEAARTDLEKRKLLARYYDLLYDKLSARAAPEMKAYLDERKNAALLTLPQPRVRPGIFASITPVPTSPTPSVTPSATPAILPADLPGAAAVRVEPKP